MEDLGGTSHYSQLLGGEMKLIAHIQHMHACLSHTHLHTYTRTPSLSLSLSFSTRIPHPDASPSLPVRGRFEPDPADVRLSPCRMQRRHSSQHVTVGWRDGAHRRQPTHACMFVAHTGAHTQALLVSLFYTHLSPGCKSLATSESLASMQSLTCRHYVACVRCTKTRSPGAIRCGPRGFIRGRLRSNAC